MLDFYKSKYEDTMKALERKGEIERVNESLMAKLNDQNKKIEFVESKVSKYKEKISEEKNKIINYEVFSFWLN